MFRYNNVQNASAIVAATDLVEGDVVGITDGKVAKSLGVTMPLGSVQAAVKAGSVVEYATGNVPIKFSSAAAVGQVAVLSAAGVVTAVDVGDEAGVMTLGAVLTNCASGGLAVVAWDPELIGGE